MCSGFNKSLEGSDLYKSINKRIVRIPLLFEMIAARQSYKELFLAKATIAFFNLLDLLTTERRVSKAYSEIFGLLYLMSERKNS